MISAWILIHEPDGGCDIEGPYDSLAAALVAEEIMQECTTVRFVDSGAFYELPPAGRVRRLVGLEHGEALAQLLTLRKAA